MPTQVFRTVYFAILLLTACHLIAASVADKIPKHVCYFDQIHNTAAPAAPTASTQPVTTTPGVPGSGSGAPSKPETGKPTETGGGTAGSGTGGESETTEQTSTTSESGGSSGSGGNTVSQTPTNKTAESSPTAPKNPETEKKRTLTKTLTLTITGTQFESMSESMSESVSESTSESLPESMSESVSESLSESVSESMSESMSESVSESMSESLSESMSETETVLPKTSSVSSLTTLSATSWTAYLAAATAAQQHDWQPLRIAFSAVDLRDPNKYCGKTGEQRTDAFNTSVTCTDKDALDEQKRQNLYKIVRAAIAMHTSRLKVDRVSGNLKVPAMNDAFCKLFTVPAAHTTPGVAGTDMVLYVASFPSSKENMFAAGAPCASQNNKRPIAGALTYTTKHIASTVYSVRVAMHEMAHALGFTYAMMKDTFNMTITDKPNVRNKTVTEVQTANVLAKTKAHYGCTGATGMELEDENGGLTVASKSHWERRNALEDLMAGIVTAGAYTALTLAAFDDMKVYQADFTKAETMEWGAKAGCDFLTKRCIGEAGKEYPAMFCKEENATKLRCAPGRRAMGRCSKIATVTGSSNRQYKYIDGTKAGEATLLTDRCPIYEEHGDTSCTQSGGKTEMGLVGPQSWCLRTKTPAGASAAGNDVCAKVSTSGTNEVNVVFAASGNTIKCAADGVTAPGAAKSAAKYTCPSFQEVRDADALLSTYQTTGKVDPSQKTRGAPPPGGKKKDGTARLSALAPLLLLLTATALLLCN